MSELNQHYAYFAVSGDFDPGSITRRVGLAPTDSWRKGDIHRRGYERKFSQWSLRSRLDKSDCLEDHIADVLAQLNQNAAAFQELSRDFEVHMQLVGYFHEGYPGLRFSSEIVAALAKFGVSVDLDFYNLWSDAREGT